MSLIFTGKFHHLIAMTFPICDLHYVEVINFFFLSQKGVEFCEMFYFLHQLRWSHDVYFHLFKWYAILIFLIYWTNLTLQDQSHLVMVYKPFPLLFCVLFLKGLLRQFAWGMLVCGVLLSCLWLYIQGIGDLIEWLRKLSPI